MEIKNLKKAAQRILSSLKKNERIVLLADSDLDGAASLIILEESILSLGGKISLSYFPDRGEEGYGLNEKALKFLKKYSPGLLILLDCGIGSFREIKEARKLGFEVIIVDHHEILAELPEAEIIVDPKQEGDEYPFKYLAACGLTFRLAQELLLGKLSEGMEKNFLELVALGTVADKMPQTEDNQIFIEEGLKNLPSTFRPGLKAFFKFLPKEEYSFGDILQKITATLQITEVKNHLTGSYLLLTASEEKEAEKLLKKLLAKSQKRLELLDRLSGEIEEKVSQKPPAPFIFEGGKEFPLILTGAVAGRISSRFRKPAFIYAKKGKVVRASVRSLQGFNSVEALSHCSRFLEAYGGHPPAAGFSLKEENLGKLKECLREYFEDYSN